MKLTHTDRHGFGKHHRRKHSRARARARARVAYISARQRRDRGFAGMALVSRYVNSVTRACIRGVPLPPLPPIADFHAHPPSMHTPLPLPRGSSGSGSLRNCKIVAFEFFALNLDRPGDTRCICNLIALRCDALRHAPRLIALLRREGSKEKKI